MQKRAAFTKAVMMTTYRWDVQNSRYNRLGTEDGAYEVVIQDDDVDKLTEHVKYAEQVDTAKAQYLTRKGSFSPAQTVWMRSDNTFTLRSDIGWAELVAHMGTPITLEVDVEVAASTSFASGGKDYVVQVDVGAILLGAVVHGTMSRFGDYTAKYVAVITGTLTKFVADKWLIKLTVSGKHASLPDDQYDSFSCHVSAHIVASGWGISYSEMPPTLGNRLCRCSCSSDACAFG